MEHSSPVDGFRLADDREGSGPPVVLLHGWPGDRFDYREVTPLLSASAELVVPDLRGFGGRTSIRKTRRVPATTSAAGSHRRSRARIPSATIGARWQRAVG